MKLWEYFKAEEEGKQIQMECDSESGWGSTELEDWGISHLRQNISQFRIRPEPLRLTVMVKKTSAKASGVMVDIQENHSFWNAGWTEATFEDGKLIVEVDDNG